jgi:hypothetical protein
MKIAIFVFLIALLSLETIAYSNESADHYKGSCGFGLGIPYGLIGVNVDHVLFGNVYISGGVGISIPVGMGYSVGLKKYAFSRNRSFRPRLSAFYGTNAIVLHDGLNEAYQGISIGVGFQWMWGRHNSHGIDLDITSIVTTNWDKERLKKAGVDFDDFNNQALSLGYRFSF